MRAMGPNGDGAVSPDQTSDLQLLINSAPSLIHTGRPDGYLDFFNQTWLKYVGRPLEDLQGWKWTAFIHPDDVEGIVERWRASLASGEPFLHEARVLRADSEYRWMLHHKVAMRDGSGQIVKWYGSSIDVEDRRRAEEQLRRSTQELQKSEFYLAEGQRLAQMGSWALDPAGFDYWSPELFRMHGLDPARKAPTIQEYLNCIHPQDRESMANLIKGLSEKASPFDVTKRIVRHDGEVRHIRCVGVPVAENRSLRKYVGSALDVTEHELVTEELRRREAYLAEAQELSHTGSFGWNVLTDEHFWSNETFRIFEFADPRKITLPMILDSIHPQDRPSVKMAMAAAANGEGLDIECRLLVLDEKIKYLHIVGRAERDSARGIEVIGAVMDITARKRTEVELRRNKVHLTDAQKLSHTGSFSWKPDTGDIVWSDETYRIFEYDRGEKPTLDMVFQRIHPNDRALAQQVIDGLSPGKEFEHEYRLVMPSGAVKNIYVRGRPLPDSSGNIEVVGAVTDITERKTAEDKIREQEMEFRQMLDLTPQHVAVIGPGQERIFANRALLNYFGLRLEEWQSRNTQTRVHPDDFERLAWGPEGGPPEQYEARLRRYDGKHRWFLVRNSPLHDERGQITRWFVAGTDIEDRKQAEERLRRENVALREEIDKASMFEEIVGSSTALKAVLSRIAKVAPTDSTVLITGETGTGKELIARAVHKRSQRSGGPFISVNCGALPSTLVSSELFGHEKGAFTGATQRQLGRFEMADGGTIFLDEVGELLPDTQAALLRVLQEREFERVGGRQPIHTDVRVIAATNRDLNAAVANGTIRRDLLYRLNVFPIEMPPLRERKDDILMLVEYFVQRYANRAGRNIRSIDQKTVDLLQSYDWPGNIRELQNVIERSIILSSTEVFSVDESWLSKGIPSQAARVETSLASKDEPLSEREIIEAALAESRGRVSGASGAAARLRVPSTTLETRIKKLKIDKRQFKFRPASPRSPED
jgi:PAS domain S-box-containing protein